jgi:Flp pilus assembly protein TadD
MPSLSSFFANRFVQLALLLLAVVLVYSNSLGGSFHFDDVFIFQNHAITHGDVFADWSGTRYIPELSFMLNFVLGGRDPYGYHLMNLILHGMTVVLVYVFARLLMSRATQNDRHKDWLPFAVALLFAVHPIQTQAVDYVSQRIAILAALFYLAAIILFIPARTSHRGLKWVAWSGALLMGLLAMKCKENSFTLPFAILLTEWFIAPRARWHERWPALAFLLLLPVIPFSHLDIMQDPGTALTRQTVDISRWTYLLTESRVVVTYLRLMFLPYGQNLDYDYPLVQGLDPWTCCAIALHLVLMAAAAVILWKRLRFHPLLTVAAYGVLWFYLTLSVESSIVPIRDVIFEHRLYLPSVGLIIAALSLGTWGLGKLPGFGLQRGIALLLTAILAVSLGGLTYARNRVWHDEISLWSDVVQRSPDKARGHSNLAIAYQQAGEKGPALKEFETAYAEAPDDAEYALNLAGIYETAGRYSSALGVLKRAAVATPDNPAVHHLLGGLYLRFNAVPQAEQEFQRAVALKPDDAGFHDDLGTAYERAGDYAAAIREYQASTGLDADNSLAWGNLGAAEQESGQMDAALRAYGRSLALDADNTRALYDYGIAELQTRHPAEACKAFGRIVQLQPADAWSAYYLALCKLQTGDKAGARALLEKVAAEAPGITPAAEALRRLPP